MEAKDEAPIQRLKMDYAYKLIEQYISLIMRNNNNRSVLRESCSWMIFTAPL